ncbi:GAP1-N1 domain-containing protein [Hymenobacter yonginensis]|uniref:Effector-associated domain EAD1-containing protein n=1 Tax=Hymenobacter yonginensis TaxID=748197 RepID=A0ABY7PJ05_9BACT|nr:effector-associated domain EAD1-containing protein [Hymenobacter yonginensis]WBO83301.1 effector-associated domain EAD1-containing protein [Hymenobacter yonginensis]
MPAAPVIIQQAYYGAVRGTSHGYLASSTSLSEQLQNFLPGFTDRPGNDVIPPGISSYLSAATTAGYFLLSRTWPDVATARSGMVFTHVLLLPLEAVPSLPDLGAVLSLLLPVLPAAANRTNLAPVSFLPAERIELPLAPVSGSLQQVGEQLFSGVPSVAVIAEPEQMEALLVRLWNGMLPSLRPLLTWATRFSPPASETVSSLLIGVPPVVAGRWSGRSLITIADADPVSDLSPQEHLLWNAAEATPFRVFLDVLEVAPVQFRALTQYERAFTNYGRLAELPATEMMSLARDVAVLQPAPSKGVSVKAAVLQCVAKVIATTPEPPLRMLRKFSLRPFADASALEAAVATRVKNLLTAATSSDDAITETFDLDTGPNAAENQQWLRTGIDATLAALLRQPTPTLTRAWWLGVQHYDDTRKKLLATLASAPETASLLAATVPAVLDKVVAEPLLALSRKRGWWELHAAVAAVTLPPAEALQRQVAAESTHRSHTSPHVAKLAQTVADDDLLDLALATDNSQLMELAGVACVRRPSLLASLDLAQRAWRQIWECAVHHSTRLTAGLTTPAATVDAYLGLLVENPTDSFPLLPLIAKSSFANVLHHPQRPALWSLLPSAFRPAFLLATANALIVELVRGQHPQLIESTLRQEVQKPTFTTRLLYTYRADPTAVLAVQAVCDNLTDYYLADYVANLTVIDSRAAVALGRLINSKRWSQSAQKVADKAKYQKHFHLALAECESQLGGWKHLFTSLFTGGADYKSSTLVPPTQLSPSNMSTEVLIMTALGLEFNAVQQILTETQPTRHPETGTRYTRGIFNHNERKFSVALAESGAGNVDAAQATERALSYFKPRYAFFVGVGGGIKDVNLGDVVASSEILHYEGGKDGEEYKSRIKTHSGAHELTELAKFIANNKMWQHRLGPANDYKAEVKPIAAGEKVVASNRSATFKLIAQSVSQAIAVEMEGYGFLAPVHSHHAKGIVIRGISDLLVNKTASDQAGWQPIAAANAAAFAAEMLARLLDDQISTNTIAQVAPVAAHPQSEVVVINALSAADTLAELLVSAPSRGKLSAILADLYERGPEERQVWKRAGGRVGFLKQTDDGDTQWHHALENLAKGGSNTITIRSLLETVKTDFPSSPVMQHYYGLL